MSCMKTFALVVTPSGLIIVVSPVVVVMMMMMIRGEACSKGRHQRNPRVCKVILQMQSLCSHEHSWQRTVL